MGTDKKVVRAIKYTGENREVILDLLRSYGIEEFGYGDGYINFVDEDGDGRTLFIDTWLVMDTGDSYLFHMWCDEDFKYTYELCQ